MSDLAREQAERLLAALGRVAELYPDGVAETLPEGIDAGQLGTLRAAQQLHPGDDEGGRG